MSVKGYSYFRKRDISGKTKDNRKRKESNTEVKTDNKRENKEPMQEALNVLIIS